MHNSIHSVDSVPLKIARINYEWIQMVCTYAVAVFQRDYIQRLADWCATVYRIDNAHTNEQKNQLPLLHLFLNKSAFKRIRCKFHLCLCGFVKSRMDFNFRLGIVFISFEWNRLFFVSLCHAANFSLKLVVHWHKIIHRKVSSKLIEVKWKMRCRWNIQRHFVWNGRQRKTRKKIQRQRNKNICENEVFQIVRFASRRQVFGDVANCQAIQAEK